MTHLDLLKEVRNLYLEARKLKLSKSLSIGNFEISRCTSHSISSEFEDLLALYIAELIGDSSVQIYIDPQITFPDLEMKNLSGKKTLLYRPDIIVVKNGEVVVMVDAKTDLGFRRLSYKSIIAHMDLAVEKFAGQIANFKMSTSAEKKTIVKLSKNIKLTYFVASSKYFTSKGDRVEDDEINKNKHTNIFFLSKGKHLNNYNNVEVKIGGIECDSESMENFDRFVLSTIRNI